MKNNQLNTFNKILYTLIVIVAFSLCFALLIKNQDKKALADINNSNLNVMTIPGRQIVAQDSESIYPRYFVAYFDNDNNYIIYCYNYYNTVSQYELEFARDINSIVDYDKSINMIRTIYLKGHGTYNNVKTNFGSIIGVNNILVY